MCKNITYLQINIGYAGVPVSRTRCGKTEDYTLSYRPRKDFNKTEWMQWWIADVRDDPKPCRSPEQKVFSLVCKVRTGT